MFYIEKLSSQHFDERNSVPRFIVLHSCYSSTHPNFFDHYSIIKLLDELRLSYHFLISRAGPVFEIVSPEKRA
ncbi:MAG: N-acetylmuramoyl-L-alanine amidase, partial [Deltaproteobacteria bacterium]|nr:N-acetylmuramoyl-L-alanine amidase [Deltaproteobacteria bacterium]